MLQKFIDMDKAKFVSSPLTSHMKLSSSQCATSKEENEEMKTMPYASVVGSLMYAMVCIVYKVRHCTCNWGC